MSDAIKVKCIDIFGTSLKLGEIYEVISTGNSNFYTLKGKLGLFNVARFEIIKSFDYVLECIQTDTLNELIVGHRYDVVKDDDNDVSGIVLISVPVFKIVDFQIHHKMISKQHQCLDCWYPSKYFKKVPKSSNRDTAKSTFSDDPEEDRLRKILTTSSCPHTCKKCGQPKSVCTYH